MARVGRIRDETIRERVGVEPVEDMMREARVV